MSSMLTKLANKLKARSRTDPTIDWKESDPLRAHVAMLLAPFKDVLSAVRDKNVDGWTGCIHGVLLNVNHRHPANLDLAKDIAGELVRVYAKHLPQILEGRIPTGEKGKYLAVNAAGFNFAGGAPPAMREALFHLSDAPGSGVGFDQAVENLVVPNE